MKLLLISIDEFAGDGPVELGDVHLEENQNLGLHVEGKIVLG